MGWLISRAALAWVVGILVALFLVGTVMFATGTFQRLTAEWRGETEAIEQTEGSGGFQVATYEAFFNLCAQVQTQEASIKALEEERDTTNPSDFRLQQINTSITALRNARAEMINEYNADAASKHKEDFMDSDLPPSLDINAEETQCHAPAN